MDESEDNMNKNNKVRLENNPPEKEKPRKRSLVERELETSLTAHITSPITGGDGLNTSRYGRARRLKKNTDFCDTEKSVTNIFKSPQFEKSNNLVQSTSPVYKMQASNSLIHENSPKKLIESNLENQIENIYNTNISLSRFGSDEKSGQPLSPAKKFSKVYMRKDLIQSKEKDNPADMSKNIFSPTKSTHKSNSHLSNILERSSEKYDLSCKPQNGYLDTSSVVKTLDFDCNKKKKKDNRERETKITVSKSDLFEIEAKCAYQVGDIAWARMGTFPFWPCIVTREPGTDLFVRKKLFGKIERDTIHVTFFGDNGRRSWILDSLLRKYQGLAEFEAARDQFTPEKKKKDQRLHAAFFISDKKLALWHTAIEEADYILLEPKRLRIDLLNELLGYTTLKKTPLKAQKSSKITRTDSDVSLSETLYDSLFSKDDGKVDEPGHKRNKSLDVSEVVTACLDNMAAKTGLTKIQRQSHMDIWLQKAKSKTPEKSQVNITITVERLEQEAQKSKAKERDSNRKSRSLERDNNNSKKKKKVSPREGPVQKPYSFRKSTESRTLLACHNEHDYSKNVTKDNLNNTDDTTSYPDPPEAILQCDNSICIIDKVESLQNSQIFTQDDISTTEIHEELTVTDLVQNHGVTDEHSGADDTCIVISDITSMDVDDINIKSKETVIDPSVEVETICENNSKKTIPNEVITDTNAFIVETDTQVARPTFLEQVDQPNLLKTDGNNLVENIDDTQKIASSLPIDKNMSIDDERSCGNSQINEENQNKVLNIQQDKNEISEEIVLKQVEHLESTDDTQKIASSLPIDKNVSIDDELSCGNNRINEENQNNVLNIQQDKNETSEKIDLKQVEHLDQQKSLGPQERKQNETHTSESTDINMSADDDITVATRNQESEIQCKTNDVNEISEGIALQQAEHLDQPKYLNPQEGKQNETQSNESTDINMSIDDDATVASCNQESKIQCNTQDKNEISEEIVLGQVVHLDQPISVNLQEEKQNETLSNESTDINMSVDDDATVLKSNQESEIQCLSLNEHHEDVGIDKEICLLKELPVSEQVSDLKNDKLAINNNVIIAKEISIKKNCKDVIISEYENKEETVINKDETKKEKAKEISSTQVTEVNKLEHIPKIKLTLIKEADIKSFRIAPSNLESPKRRSLRNIKYKKVECKPMEEPLFLQYLEMRQDAIIDEYPELNHNEIVTYLYKTWQFETDLSQKQTSNLRKSNSPSDFGTKVVENDTISDQTLVDKTKNDVKVVDDQPSREMRTTNKHCLSLRKSQLLSVPKKTSEGKLNNELALTNITDSKLDSKPKETVGKQESKEAPVINNNNNSKITDAIEHADIESKSENPVPVLNDAASKDIYIVTPKKRSLCLRISKANFEPKVVLEREDIISEMQNANKKVTKLKQINVVSNKHVESNHKIPVLKMVKSKTDLEHNASQSVYEIKRSKRRSRKSKSFSEPVVLDNKEENSAVLDVDEMECNQTKTESQSNIQSVEKEIKVNNDVIPKMDLDVESTSKVLIHEITEPQTDEEVNALQTKSELKRSKRRLRKSKSFSQPVELLDYKKEHIKEEINSKKIETDTHTDKMPVVEGASSKTNEELEPPKKRTNNSIESKTEAEATVSQTNSESRRSKRRSRKSQSFSETIVSLEDNEENNEILDAYENAEPMDTDTQTYIRIISENETPIAEEELSEMDIVFEVPLSKRRSSKLQEPKASKATVEPEVAVLESDLEINCSMKRSRKSKLFSEDNKVNKKQVADETNGKSSEQSVQSHNTETKSEIPLIDDIYLKDRVSKNNYCTLSEFKQVKSNSDKGLEDSMSKINTKLSERRIRRSKSSIAPRTPFKDMQKIGIPFANRKDFKLIEADTQTHNKIVSECKTPVIDLQFETDSEWEVPLSKRRSSSSSIAPTTQFKDMQKIEIPFVNRKDCELIEADTQTHNKIVSECKTPVIDLLFETDSEWEVPLSKRRSLRLRKSQSASPIVSLEQQEYHDLTVTNETYPAVTETTEVESQLYSDIHTSEETGILTIQNESSNITNVPGDNKFTKEQEEIVCIPRNSVDNISLDSEFTNGLTDCSSDKDFDPDTVSISSLSSDISDITVLPRTTKRRSISEKPNVFQKILEPDNDSVSSMDDDVVLSELKIKSTKEVIYNLRQGEENSMDSIRSDTSERRLRLVLTDCLVDSKVSKLPIIEEVGSKTCVEIEISQSNSELNIPKLSTESKTLSVPKVNGFHEQKESPKVKELGTDPDTISIKSSGSEASFKRKGKNRQEYKPMEEPEFLQYIEMRQDALIDEHPEVTPDEIVAYLYKTWQYEESLKSDIKKNDEIESSNLVKGVNQITQEPPKKKKVMKQKNIINFEKIMAKSPKKEQFRVLKDEHKLDQELNSKERELPKRKASKAFYKEDFSDIEDEIEIFEIFKSKKKEIVPKTKPLKEFSTPDATYVKSEIATTNSEAADIVKDEINKSDPKEETVINLEEEFEEYYDEEELYFEQLTNLKPNVFKGLIREKVCEICEKASNLVKCKGCSGMFHIECVKKEDEFVDTPAPTRGRKKKKKPRGRKPKSSMDSNEESHSDEKCQDLNMSEENVSTEEINGLETIVIPDADNFESQLEAKMKEIIEIDKIEYDSYSSDDGIDWSGAIAGKCEIVDVKLKMRSQSVNTDDFKCKNCQKDDTPLCFVCKSPVAPKNGVERRQKCQVAHCHKYYHLECLEHWPQTQFNAGEPSRNNKKIDEHFEAMACPRHVCHTCVCDDPRGCKTRFCGDKLARCVRCPATYHSFTKCLPAGSQILSASHIVCPRHYEHRPGKIPYHVNTGWCFICALGGNLICCDYCPTSFHADCLNIEPPEGDYMCEDCETGRLPLYGEMVWVKLGHYRWWPGIVLHPSEIPDNIMAVKHSPGEFVVRFFGQYDHYWVNRGRVFPFQEGDSGRISTQKSKIDEAFTIAMEHAQRAFEILKNVEPNDEESQDIQSSLLPPHYVKLKVNRPCGALYGRKVDIEESSLTQCECNPDEEEPCGPYSHCLNRMLLTECGPICRAGERCQNRAFEKRLYPKLVPYRTPHRGWGLKTLEPIRAGQFVIEYVGELIDEAEFRRRMQRKHETRDENFYFLTLDKERLIDAGPKGNLARFMNHCCEPNCETQKWTVLGDVRVGLFALHDIPANTEVTFNYNLECTGIEKKQCMCGAKRCAGYIGAKPKQDDPQPKKLKRTYKKRKNTIDSPSTSKQTNKPKRPVGRPAKPRELTDIEKDLLIIKNATNGISSDSECSGRTSVEDKEKKALKRKRVSFSTEEVIVVNGESPSVKTQNLNEDETSSPIVKKQKLDEDETSSPSVKIQNLNEGETSSPSVKKQKLDEDETSSPSVKVQNLNEDETSSPSVKIQNLDEDETCSPSVKIQKLDNYEKSSKVGD